MAQMYKHVKRDRLWVRFLHEEMPSEFGGRREREDFNGIIYIYRYTRFQVHSCLPDCVRNTA